MDPDNEKSTNPLNQPVLQGAREDEITGEFCAVELNEFYTSSGLDLDASGGATLTDDQKTLLETVSRLSDTEGFTESNPTLADKRSLRPQAQMPQSLDTIPTPVTSAPQPTKPLTTKQGLEGAGVVNTLTYEQLSQMKGEGGLTTDLLTRKGGDHVPGALDAASLPRRSEPMSLEVKLALGLAFLAVLMFGFAFYNQSRADAEVDRIQQAQTFSMVEESVETKSTANKMDQPFRMPAGRVGPLGSSGSGTVNTSNNSGDWHPPANPVLAPTAEQVAAGTQAIVNAENMQALGKSSQAAIILSAALGQCPGNVQLRVATVRCYMALQEYRTARMICQEGMRNARSASDFAILQGLLAQIPTI